MPGGLDGRFFILNGKSGRRLCESVEEVWGYPGVKKVLVTDWCRQPDLQSDKWKWKVEMSSDTAARFQNVGSGLYLGRFEAEDVTMAVCLETGKDDCCLWTITQGPDKLFGVDAADLDLALCESPEQRTVNGGNDFGVELRPDMDFLDGTSPTLASWKLEKEEN